MLEHHEIDSLVKHHYLTNMLVSRPYRRFVVACIGIVLLTAMALKIGVWQPPPGELLRIGQIARITSTLDCDPLPPPRSSMYYCTKEAWYINFERFDRSDQQWYGQASLLTIPVVRWQPLFHNSRVYPGP